MTLVVLGASDAWGVGSDDPDRLNWPSTLASDLDQPVHLINLGIPGATLAQAERDEVPVALDARPNVVVIWLAVNDIIASVPLATYTTELGATLTTFARQAPGTRVYVGNVPDLTQIPYFSGADAAALRAQVLAWNSAIAQECADTGATLVNLYATWNQFGDNPEYISADGLHPSQLGADALARAFSVAIELSSVHTAKRERMRA
jgi:lysophospholipase L1-like esterase